jgi:cation/acetate symporter
VRADKAAQAANAVVARLADSGETSLVGLRAPLVAIRNPAIISIPLAFLAAVLGSLLFRDPHAAAQYVELRVRRIGGVRV